jgi:hypothetical protein
MILEQVEDDARSLAALNKDRGNAIASRPWSVYSGQSMISDVDARAMYSAGTSVPPVPPISSILLATKSAPVPSIISLASAPFHGNNQRFHLMGSKERVVEEVHRSRLRKQERNLLRKKNPANQEVEDPSKESAGPMRPKVSQNSKGDPHQMPDTPRASSMERCRVENTAEQIGANLETRFVLDTLPGLLCSAKIKDQLCSAPHLSKTLARIYVIVGKGL